jgi:hypothetical protein
VYVDPSELFPIITLIVDVATNSPVKVVTYVVECSVTTPDENRGERVFSGITLVVYTCPFKLVVIITLRVSVVASPFCFVVTIEVTYSVQIGHSVAVMTGEDSSVLDGTVETVEVLVSRELLVPWMEVSDEPVHSEHIDFSFSIGVDEVEEYDPEIETKALDDTIVEAETATLGDSEWLN